MTPLVSRIRIFCLIALGGMSALFGAENWSSFHTILTNRYDGLIPQGYYQYYTSPSSNSVPYICSGILYCHNHPFYGTKPIGGFDLVNGFVVKSYFADALDAYTANTGEGTNLNNNYDYYWEVYYDYNHEGTLGTQTLGVIVNRSKLLDPSKYCITNFTPYPYPNPNVNGPTPGTFEFQMTDPTVGLSISSLDVNRASVTNVITLSVSTAATAQGVLSLQYKDALTNSTWQFLSSHAIPSSGAVVSVTETNAVPSRFYQAVAPK